MPRPAKTKTKAKKPIPAASPAQAPAPVAPPIEPPAPATLPIIQDGDDYTPPEERFEEKDETGAQEKYYSAVGRRKEAIARVRLSTRKSTDELKEDRALMAVNGKEYQDYFKDSSLITRVESPLRKLKSLNRFKATVLVRGGGASGQAEAVAHGLARALEKFDTNFRKKLKKSNLLTRDPRVKERRKYGHKKARKMGRWSKR